MRLPFERRVGSLIMMTIVNGKNIFDSKFSTLVCPVNCSYVMGAGLAYHFKNRFDGLFNYYKQSLSHGLLEITRPDIWVNPKGQNVILFPTKDNWRNPSELEWIDEGLEYIVTNEKHFLVGSVCFPLLGVGCGKLKREDVLSTMMPHLKELANDVSLIV